MNPYDEQKSKFNYYTLKRQPIHLKTVLNRTPRKTATIVVARKPINRFIAFLSFDLSSFLPLRSNLSLHPPNLMLLPIFYQSN